MRHCWGTMTMPHTRFGHDRDRSRNTRTRNRRLGPLVQHPPPPLPGRHHTTTSRKPTHNNPKGRPRTRQAWLGLAAQSKQLAGPGGAVQTAGWARRRQGLTGLRDDEPSGRLAAQTTSGPPSARLASLARHKARARGAHTTRPGPAAPNSAEDPGLDSKSDQSIHHEVREGLERGLRLALRQRSQGSDRVAGPGARQLARLLQHVMAAQLLDDRGQGLVGG